MTPGARHGAHAFRVAKKRTKRVAPKRKGKPLCFAQTDITLATRQTPLTIEQDIPVLTIGETNAREHHMATHRRKKSQQLIVKRYLSMDGSAFREGVSAVHITRLGGRKMDPSDGLPAAHKHVQDEVARWLGIDDGDERVKYTYDQDTKNPVRGTRIRFTYGGAS